MGDRKFLHKKNRDDAIRLLKIVTDILDKYQIDYYLDFGTLIGAVREKSLIPWDDDIDISLLNKEDFSKIPKVLEEIRKKYRLRTYLYTFKEALERRKRKGKPLYCNNISFANMNDYQIAKVRNNKFLIFGRGNSCIDIFFKYEHDGKLWWMAYGQENNVPLEVFSKDLIEIDFCGIRCKILKEYDRYLTAKYGDWKTPKENWSHEKDDYSVVSTIQNG